MNVNAEVEAAVQVVKALLPLYRTFLSFKEILQLILKWSDIRKPREGNLEEVE